MKKAILRILLLICGLNVFTACYGMPPGEWPEPAQLPEEPEQTKAPAQSDEGKTTTAAMPGPSFGQ